MKLRVKLHRQSQVISLEGREPGDVTLEELRTIVASNFGLEDIDFHLSLNKTDALPADDQVLSSVGIVSSDLLHIIGPNLPQLSPASVRQRNQRPQPLASHTSSDGLEPSTQISDVSMATVASSSVGTLPQENGLRDQPIQDSEDVSMAVENSIAEEEPQINRYLNEPLMVRESTSTCIPALLEQLYLSATCGSSTDALWVVLHTLMLEAGFCSPQVTDATQIPPNWKQSGFYKCTYQLAHVRPAQGECSVVGMPVGSSLIVHGLAGSESPFKTEHLQLKPSDFVNALSDNVPEVYVGLDRLSRQFKDTICLPLEAEMSAASNVPGGQGFISLPYEIKIRILSCLDALTLCHLAQTRSDMGSLAREKVVWRRIYIRDFGRPVDDALTRDWYELYKETFIERREEERRRQQFRLEQTQRLFGYPGAFRPQPNPGLRFPPHMIGGDYDLNPEFAAGGVPNPLGRDHGRRGGPILPNVGIPDPMGHDPLGLGPVGRSGRGNLTGSPFGRGGQGSLFRGPFM